MSLKDKTTDITVSLPSLVATQEFEPTALMIKTVSVYLEGLKSQEESLTPPQVLVQIGHGRQNWYNWLKRPLFKEWWDKVCTEFYTNTALYNVHGAIYRRAMANSDQAAKMFLERFDKDYKPATAQEHSFPGIAPPEDADAAIERSRQRALENAPKTHQDAPGQENPGQGVE